MEVKRINTQCREAGKAFRIHAFRQCDYWTIETVSGRTIATGLTKKACAQTLRAIEETVFQLVGKV